MIDPGPPIKAAPASDGSRLGTLILLLLLLLIMIMIGLQSPDGLGVKIPHVRLAEAPLRSLESCGRGCGGYSRPVARTPTASTCRQRRANSILSTCRQRRATWRYEEIGHQSCRHEEIGVHMVHFQLGSFLIALVSNRARF